MLALLTVAYPAVRCSFELILGPYEFDYLLFFAAVWLAFRSEASEGAARGALRLSALATFFVSFGINSLLVFYFGILFLMGVRLARQRSIGMRAALVPFVRARLDYVLLPFFFWTLSKTLFAPTGDYARYYQLKPSPFNLGYQFLQQIWFSLCVPLNEVVPRALAASLGCTVFAICVVRLYQTAADGAGWARPGQILLFSVALLFLGVLPYSLIGGHSTSLGWASRHALLMPLPVSILLLAGVRLVGAPERQQLSLAGVAVLAVLAAGFGATMIDNYLGYEARAAKDEAVVRYLGAHRDLAGYSVFWIGDEIPFYGDTYRFYEWAAMMRQAWDDESHVGLDLAAFPHRDMAWLSTVGQDRHRFNMATFDPQGRWATMTLRKGPSWGGASDARIGLQHIAYRYVHRERLKTWMDGLVDVNVDPEPSVPQAAPSRTTTLGGAMIPRTGSQLLGRLRAVLAVPRAYEMLDGARRRELVTDDRPRIHPCEIRRQDP